MIRVVSAAIIRRLSSGQSEILLCRRAPGTHYAGLWCTPSGKVEPGECDTEALARAVLNGTGLVVWSVDPRPVYKYTGAIIPQQDTIVFCHEVRVDTPRRIVLNLAELDDYGWFRADDLDGLGLAPADTANRDALKKLLQEEGR